MFRASAGRFLLLSAAVFLFLWSTLCIALPTVFTLPEPPGHWKDDSSLEAYLQNQPHYKSHPMLDVPKTAEPTTKYARDNLLFPKSSAVGPRGNKLIKLFSMLHKRSVVSSAQAGLDDTSTIKLTKRMDGGRPSYNGREDRLVNIDQIRHQSYEAPGADEVLTPDGKERRYAGMVHHNGIPVFQGEAVWYSDLNHALHDHDYIWLMPNRPGATPLTIDKEGLLRGRDWPAAQSHLNAANQARNAYGAKIMLLKYGRPFPARASSSRFLGSYKPPSWKKKVAKGQSWPLATSDVYHLRQQLNQQGHIRIYDEDNRKTWGLRLLKDGKVDEIKDITDLVDRIHRRALTESQPEPEPDWTQIESHTQHVPQADPSLRMSTKDRGRYFAGDLHYKGEPIIFPGEASGADTLAKVQRARNNYPGYWIVGHPRHNPAALKATYIADGRVLQTSEQAALLRNLGDMNQVMYRHDQDPPLHKYGYLKYGPDFPKRSKFSIYRLPDAEVNKDAPRLSSSASMADKWGMLYEKSMLVINKGKSEVGYALNRAGEVSRIPL